MMVSKWGNSLAIRLPAVVVEALKLKEGDAIDVSLLGPRQIAVERTSDREAWLDRLDKYRGRLPADFKFDREEANGR